MSNEKRVVAFLLIAQIIHLAGCQLGTVEIDYVFPDGFRGAAIIRENQPAGQPACKFLSLPGTHRCVLSFPSSGILTIQSELPSTHWHRASARYVSGTVIPVPDSALGIVVSKGDIGMWSYGAQEGEEWVFVGTEDEFMKFKQEKEAYKYPPDSRSPSR